MKKLSVESVMDGYSVKYLSCDDLVCATLAGYYDKKYYDIYCFIRSCMYNWKGFKPDVIDNIMQLRSYILGLMGLKLRVVAAETEQDFFNLLEENIIQKGIPLEMPVKTQALFYRMYTKKNDQAAYSIILSGYDKEHNLAMIQDNTITRWNLKHAFRGEVFCRLQITSAMLEDIRRHSSEMFKEQNGWSDYILTYVEKPDEKKPDLDILDYFLESAGKDLLQESILEYNEKVKNNAIWSEDAYMENFLKKHHLNIEVVFDVFESYFQLFREEKYESFCKIKNEYLSEREIIVMKIAKNIARRVVFEEQYIEKVNHQLEELDCNLKRGLNTLRSDLMGEEK